MFVARNGIFLEREHISKGTSGSKVQLDKIRAPKRSIEPVMETQQVSQDVVEPTHVTQDLKRSNRICQNLERYGFLVTENHDVILMDNDEPTSYQEAISNPDSDRWLEAKKSEMQPMYDNQVWTLIDPPDGLKTIGCKWVFKKKTDMDGNVYTFKERLVAKGLKQTHGVHYDETFSPVAMLKSIRIPLAIVVYYNYEIWKMDVKTTFLNGKLLEDVYVSQPEGFVNLESIGKVC